MPTAYAPGVTEPDRTAGSGATEQIPTIVVGMILALIIYLVVKLGRQPADRHVIPLILTPEEGGFVVRSPLLPELITEGDSLAEAIANARDALVAVKELYEELGLALPLAARSASPVDVQFEVTYSAAPDAAA